MNVRSKARNLPHLKLLPRILIANKQIILERNAGMVPMPLNDQNGSKKTN